MVSDSKTKIAYVIVTYNSGDLITQCIDSINQQFVQHCQSDFIFSVIAIDNNSSDQTVKLLNDLCEKYSWLSTIFLDENIGFGRANNRGFSAVDSDYYILINADAWLLADSISPAIKTMKDNSSIAICGLPLVFPDGTPQTYAYSFSSWHRWMLAISGAPSLVKKIIKLKLFIKILELFPYARNFIRIQKKPPINISNVNPDHYHNEYYHVDWVCGAAMIISKKFLKETNGFDPNIFLYGEDEDLCITAHQRGYDVIVTQVAPVAHMLGWGKGVNPKVADLKYLSLRYFIRKNIKPNIPRLFMALLLPFYVYGYRKFYRALSINNRTL